MRQTLATMALLGLLAAVVPMDAYADWSGGMSRGSGRPSSGSRPGWGQNSSTHRSSSGWSNKCRWSNCSRWSSSRAVFVNPWWGYAPYFSSFLYGWPGYAGGQGGYYATSPMPDDVPPPTLYGNQQGLSLDHDVVFPEGRYVLQGDGIDVPYRWVWIPNPPTAPPPPNAR